MRLTFLGVRGSTPAPGPAHVRYGGNTSCVALSVGNDVPRLVLDAGTGITRLTGLLGGAAFDGTILLGHLHWDHTQGLPFVAAADRADARVRLLMPAQGEPMEILHRWMSPPHFPIGPGDLRGDWNIEGIAPGLHEIEGFRVLAREIPHPGGRTFGYRIDDGMHTCAYLSDHGPVALGQGPDGWGPYHETAVELAAGVDLLIHDAQHTAAEFPARAHFGHSTVDYAVGLAEAAGSRRLVLFHHDPFRSDDDLDALVAELRAGAAVEVDAADEEMVIDLAAATAIPR